MCRFIISLNEILNNLNIVKSKLSKNTKVCAVVKANAYGFGYKKICSLLKDSVDYFAVARLNEFIKYKELEINKPCLILTPLLEKEISLAIKNGAELTISSCSNIEYINNCAIASGQEAKVHIKIDTGMSRYGVRNEQELRNMLIKIKECSNIKVIGVYSHIYDAENIQSTRKQRYKLLKAQSILKEFGYTPITHFAASQGLKDSLNQFDMVRLGIDLYSGKDRSEHKLCSSIREIKNISKGDIVGYSARFKARKNMKIAICGAGYADGVSRLLSSHGEVLIKGEKTKILGNVCMDSFMVDITKIKNVKVGDEVVIFGNSGINSIYVCEVAKKCGTISYEIYTSISERVKRVYKWRENASYNRKI